MYNAKAYSAASATAPLASDTIARRNPTETDVQLAENFVDLDLWHLNELGLRLGCRSDRSLFGCTGTKQQLPAVLAADDDLVLID